MTPLTPGASPVADCTLVEEIGQGTCGVVWKATRTSGEPVALKFVRCGEHAPGGVVETRALDLFRSIRHPHLITLHDSWVLPDYLVICMELAERTLWDRL